MKIFKYLFLSAAVALGFTACSDDLEDDSYYTFTGEMMSDYITSRPQYSDFAEVVRRAELMDLLSTYGHYTCFLPNNTAMGEFLAGRGKGSVADLTDADCDTIARTHLVGNMYTVMEMNVGTLHTANMNRRYIQVDYTTDPDGNPVVRLNRDAYIYYETQDDSVENGIVHPISKVLESSNSSVVDLMKENPRVKLFYNALVATGLDEELMKMKDETYEPTDYNNYYYVSDFWHEIATVPDTKKFGFTVFVEPDEVLVAKAKTNYGITIEPESENATGQLLALAKAIYDATYPEDAGLYDNDLTHPKNPLNRFLRYHILTCDVIGWNLITTKEIYSGVVQGALGIHIEKMNPIDWYRTLLPNTMMKFEQLTVRNYVGNGIMNDRYINRRYDDNNQIEGIWINPEIESNLYQDAPNGRYFYVNDIVAFTTDVRDKVQNMRIRMDFSTLFPEMITNNIRLNGDPTTDDDSNVADPTFKNGRNYWFPNGYLDGMNLKAGTFVYRRPHWNFWSYQGDECNLFGNYDIEFRLPPVPYSGEWQVRLGFCALDTRGIAQVYFDGKPQGIPLDMRVTLNNEKIMGSIFDEKNYTSMTDEERAEDQKALKNKGYYRGAFGGYHSNGSAKTEFVNNPRTFRIVLYQGSITNTEDHYLRIRCASSIKTGNDNEFMLDYLEMVPKSVYGIIDDGEIEDDL